MKSVPDHAKKALTVLAFDFGGKRVGLAVGNTLTCTAQPLTVLIYKNKDQLFQNIKEIMLEWNPDQFIVGLPTHPDGQPHEMTQQAVRFANQLEGRFGKKVVFVDERYSTVVISSTDDSKVAAGLAEQYLNSLN
jgi:putative Holliday junction resolvase